MCTLHHPGSDHKGILYKIKGNTNPLKVDTPTALPHRAFDLPEVINFTSDRLAEFNASTTSSRECFGEWDVLKPKLKTLPNTLGRHMSGHEEHTSKRSKKPEAGRRLTSTRPAWTIPTEDYLDAVVYQKPRW